jgi:hypothetical protein
MRGVELWQDQVLKGDSDYSLCMKPAVGNNTNIVLGRKRLKDWNGEHKILRFLSQHLKGEEHILISQQANLMTSNLMTGW